MYVDDMTPSWFLLWWYLCNLVSSGKKICGFLSPEIMKQCSDFAAGTYGFWDPINF